MFPYFIFAIITSGAGGNIIKKTKRSTEGFEIKLVSRKTNKGIVLIIMGIVLILFSLVIWYQIVITSGTKNHIDNKEVNQEQKQSYLE